ncbi:DUF6197 family protein [Bailinhaonella thermotolerans]|uniref:Uncharacterized protein n=1 Tax=Bailinhaonella thermotolerans TaxID=1070861 RepID=A0A3A4A1P1_9ACTN|nr:hypothetical protein [Bailinhaonella thermotolerans]RJL21064.1 hypothetical protein D5H75_38265 [Bailinhaonella thermotolerans]
MDRTPQAVLTSALDVLRTQGLVCGAYYDRDQDDLPPARRRVCPMGAIAVACGHEPDLWLDLDPDKRELWENEPSIRAAFGAAWALVRELRDRDRLAAPVRTRGEIHVTVIHWVDYVAQSKGEILEVMRAAARRTDDQGLPLLWREAA